MHVHCSHRWGKVCPLYAELSTRSLHFVKDKLPLELTTHSIYSVKCNTCGDEYVGETLCVLNVRAKEHRDAVHLGETVKAAIAQHVHDQEQPHEIEWETLSVLDKAQAHRERKLMEALYIKKRQPKINRGTAGAGIPPNMALHFLA